MDGERLRTRLLLGALAGVVGTAAMTSAMSRLHRALPSAERYPLPPRELVEPLVDGGTAHEAAVKDVTTAVHFGFGASAGALIAALAPRLSVRGWVAAGVGVWAASYLGWAPAVAGLKSATAHPPRRSGLMILVHLLWGATAAATLHELRLSRRTMLAAGPLLDRRRSNHFGSVRWLPTPWR